MSAIDEVKQKTDIADVIGQYTTLKKAGRNLTALCPFHSEKNPSFFVYPEQQSWHCFGACNTGGDVFAFIMKKENVDFPEALRLLAQRAGVTLPTKSFEAKKEEKEEYYQVNEAAALYFHNILLNSGAAETARKYVEKRGFTHQTVTDFQLGFSPDSWDSLKNYLAEKGYSQETMLTAGLLVQGENDHTYDRFRGKLMFPIREIRGRVTGFGARVLDDSLPKYVNSPQSPTFDKSSTLYAIDRAAGEIRKQDQAIIMEGYMDIITAHQNGITNVVASMGTAITETQVNILKKLTKHFILAFDADTAGIEANKRGGEIVLKPSNTDLAYRTTGYSSHLNEADLRKATIIDTRVINEQALDIDASVVVIPEGKDPDDVIKEDVNQWNSLVEQSVPLMDFIFNKVTASLDLKTLRGQQSTIEVLGPIVDQIKNQKQRSHYVQKLAFITNTDIRIIEGAIIESQPKTIKNRKFKVNIPNKSIRITLSDPREEYLLALLLQHPELKEQGPDLSVYLENTENREIYDAWMKDPDPMSLKERLDPAFHEHFDAILKRTLPDNKNNAEKRYQDCVLELEKRYYRKLEARRAEILALEAESGGPGADIARLQQEGLEPSARLRDLELRKGRRNCSR